MPAKKTTKIVATSQPVQPKKYELINKRAAPIAINCISTVLQVPGGVSGKVIVTERLDDMRRFWISAFTGAFRGNVNAGGIEIQDKHFAFVSGNGDVHVVW